MKYWKQIRFWILLSWCFLTVGILLGSWWAYHELGWGGWWFWDPVENASLMPWLLATASIHSITKSKLSHWTLISIQGTFLLSILGTFFVRSGLLSSVHSFATDSTRGLFLLLFLLFILVVCFYSGFVLFYFTGKTREKLPFFALHIFRSAPSKIVSYFKTNNQIWTNAHIKRSKGVKHGIDQQDHHYFKLPKSKFLMKNDYGPIPSSLIQITTITKKARSERRESISNSKKKTNSLKQIFEQILLLQNFYFTVICAVIFLGTSAPIISQWIWNRDIGTGAPFYNNTLIPLFTSLLIVLVYAHFLPFKNFDEKKKTTIFIQNTVFFFKKVTADNRGSAQFIKDCLQHLKYSLSHSSDFFKNSSYLLALSFICFASFHFLFHTLLLKLNLLNSIYSTLCFLLISSILLVNEFKLVVRKKKQNKPIGWSRRLLINDVVSTPNRYFVKNTISTNTSIRMYNSINYRYSLKEMYTSHTGIVLFLLGIILSNTYKLELTEQLHSTPTGIRLNSQICYLRSIDHSYAPTFHSICANLVIYPNVLSNTNLQENKDSKNQWNQLFNNFLIPHHKIGMPRTSLWFTKEKLLENTSFSATPELQNFTLCLFPEKRFYYSNAGSITTKVAIHSNLFTDFYGLIGTGSAETGWFTTIMKFPFIFCIWLGFSIATFGGILALKKLLHRSKLNWI